MIEPVSSSSLPSEPAAPEAIPDTASSLPSTAGGLLRQARQARGLHIAALATSIKVTPRKLELLEADRFDELPGATFTRALAQTVCRTLKIDSAPVLALLPAAPGHGLEQMSRGLNEPFRDRPGRQLPKDFAFLKNPVRLGAAALVALAVLVYVLPDGWIGQRLNAAGGRAAAPMAASDAAEAASAVVADPSTPLFPDSPASGTTIETVHSAPAEPEATVAPGVPPTAAPSVATGVPAGASATAPTTATAAVAGGAATASAAAASTVVSGALQLRATSESWVEVIDRRGVALLSRMLQPGETVGLDGAAPLKLKIGNAQATHVTFKGAAVDLAPVTSRDNVAKLELK